MAERVWVRSDLGTTQSEGLTAILWPLVALKQGFDALYQLLLSLIWSKLTGTTKMQISLQAGKFSLFFIAFSLAIFYLHAYEGGIFIAFVLIWWLDRLQAHWQYFKSPDRDRISLSITPEQGVYRLEPVRKTRSHPAIARRFSLRQIRQVLIRHHIVRGGAFQSVLGEVWSVGVQLRDGGLLRVYESANPAIALRQARDLASKLLPDTAVKFDHSVGDSPYAMRAPHPQLVGRYTHRKIPAFKTQLTPRGWQFWMRWSHLSMGTMLGQMMERAGFIIFVLLMTEVMENLGALLHGSALVYQDSEASRMLLVGAIQDWALSPDWPDLAEGAIALGLVIAQGIAVTKPRSLLLTRRFVDYYRRHRRVARVPTSTLLPPLMIEGDMPMLLILGETTAIAFKGLVSEELRYGAWLHFQQGRAVLQAASLEASAKGKPPLTDTSE